MADYTHHKKADGMWNSICMTCYRTAAASRTEPELRETEAMHKCGGSPQSQLIRQVPDFLQKRLG
jgi:hypothetical protein